MSIVIEKMNQIKNLLKKIADKHGVMGGNEKEILDNAMFSEIRLIAKELLPLVEKQS